MQHIVHDVFRCASLKDFVTFFLLWGTLGCNFCFVFVSSCRGRSQTILAELLGGAGGKGGAC